MVKLMFLTLLKFPMEVAWRRYDQSGRFLFLYMNLSSFVHIYNFISFLMLILFPFFSLIKYIPAGKSEVGIRSSGIGFKTLI